MNRPARARINVAELRRELVKAGLDPEYWSAFDVMEMERRGCTVAQMVRAALQHASATPRRVSA
jgi:hypothetical protein